MAVSARRPARHGRVGTDWRACAFKQPCHDAGAADGAAGNRVALSGAA
ncbi:hypothetical protein BN2497_9915 [Janthinobacterium sp. CG23_2]|nr:hypothetical protein BN2497_9915 [Janthinobacterium sp. CG23_2]CUU31355.1 hypothetical protein BN3177_9915 [Janthinobacterium sp. CG23_2]